METTKGLSDGPFHTFCRGVRRASAKAHKPDKMSLLLEKEGAQVRLHTN